MTGAIRRLIARQGRTYTVRNASGGSGRGGGDYQDDGELVAVLERRGRPRTFSDSAGEDIDADLELRAVGTEDVTIRPAGDAGEYPTVLVHPSGQTYRVVDDHVEDGGVHVLAVVQS
jgi:hypothetical protein